MRDFEQFFKLHAMVCDPPKPDLFVVYMLCRGLGLHAGIAHDAGMWRTSKALDTEPDIILVYTTSGYHPCVRHERTSKALDTEPEVILVPTTSGYQPCVRHEPDWTHVIPPKDKPSKSSQHPDSIFKSVQGIAQELVSTALEAFPEDFAEAMTTIEQCTTPADTTTAGEVENCEATAEMYKPYTCHKSCKRHL